MEKFDRLTAIACPLPLEGIDTDQLAPARFLKRRRSEGYGPVLLHDLRATPGFTLTAPAYAGARILVARRNFGGGSSREAAVYALLDFGIRCVVAPSFGDIFASNAVGNGLLPAIATAPDVETLPAKLQSSPGELTIDLHACRIEAGPHTWPFTIDPVWREKLLQGFDDIDLTRSRQPEIDAFVRTYESRYPWA